MFAASSSVAAPSPDRSRWHTAASSHTPRCAARGALSASRSSWCSNEQRDGDRETGQVTPAPAAVSPPVWLLAGQIIIDRDPRPAMIVDAAGRIRAANRPLVEQRARASSELLGRKWVDAWPFDSNGARAAAEAMARAHQGEVAHVTLGAPTPQGDTAISLFELTAVGIDAALIVSILATKLAGTTEGVQPASGLHYEIEAEAPWRLRHVWSAEARPLRTEGPCVTRRFTGARSRARAALLSASTTSAQRRGAEHSAQSGPSLAACRGRLVNARRIPGGAISVSAWAVDDSLLSALIAAKVDALAKMSGLSGRERSVLDLLLLGRSHAEIGTVLVHIGAHGEIPPGLHTSEARRGLTGRSPPRHPLNRSTRLGHGRRPGPPHDRGANRADQEWARP